MGFRWPKVALKLRINFEKTRLKAIYMTTDLLPKSIKDKYEVHEWRHACSILAADFKKEFQEIIDVLQKFELKKTEILRPGKGKSEISNSIDQFLYGKGWLEKQFDTRVLVDDTEKISPTHKVDCYKNRVALEIEWNNKDPFFDRDLNNFRLLFDLGVISVGVIVTRCDELQKIFNELGKGKSYGASTTHMSKLLPRIEGGGGAGCPILVFGITRKLYNSRG